MRAGNDFRAGTVWCLSIHQRADILVTSVAVLLFDQVTKAVAGATLHMAWLDFTLNHRTGWGLIHLPMHYIAMITALGLLMVGLFGWRMVVTRRLSPFLLGLVIGGGTGNLIDRLAIGAVRDFLVGPWDTVFNLADLAIVVGAIGWANSARAERL